VPNVLIWGASGGIGSACVDVFSANGWQVWGAARDEDQVALSATALEFDAGQPDRIQKAVMQVAQETTELDLVIYAVGSLTYERLTKMSAEDWHSTLMTNLTGGLYVVQHSLDLLKKGGYIFFIGAYVDHLRIPGMGVYSVAKAALEELVVMLRKENRKHHFVVVRPGAVNTSFWAQVGFKMPDDAKNAKDVAQAILRHYNSNKTDDLNL